MDGLCTPKMQGLNHLSKRQVGSLSELRYLFEELASWSKERQESQIRLDNLLSSYSGSIKKGINSLIEEVGDLQAKNSLITKERNDLHVIVNKMSVGIEQPWAQYPFDKLVLEAKENSNQEVDGQITDILKVERVEEVEGGSKKNHSLHIPHENHDEKVYVGHVDQTMPHPQEKTDQVIPQLDHCINNFTDEDGVTNEHVVMEEQVTKNQFDSTYHEEKETVTKNKRRKPHKSKQLKSTRSNTKNLKCQRISFWNEGKGPTTCKINGKGSLKTQLNKPDKSHNEVNNIKGGFGKTLMCDQCPYETSHKGHFLQHSEVHQTRNHLCEKCPYKAKTKDTLKGHIKAVHEKIKDKVCEACGYATSRWGTLNEHRQTVHNTGEKKFSCDQCPYRAYLKKILVKHIKNVHIGREHKFKCEKCDFKSDREGNLTTHILQVHK